MTLLSTNAAVAAACQRFSAKNYICVDTEFMRDRTYYPVLCLIQIASAEDAVAIDPLAPGLDLSPILELMINSAVLKVFHACRQDMGIFFQLADTLPKPIFDTQIAAMVCGHGDSVSYGKLVQTLTGTFIDKTSQFTNWAHRPLSDRQVRYALSDVIHLRPVYESLIGQLAVSERMDWLREELDIVMDPATYDTDPAKAWRRIKLPRGSRRFLALIRELATYREAEAQRRNLPRNWVLRDDVLVEIAARSPKTADDLAKVRTITREFSTGRAGSALLKVVARANALPESDCPKPPENTDTPAPRSTVELLRVLLKHKAEEHNVAPKLIATSADLDAMALDDKAPVLALKGWRRDLFGADALALKHGKLALAGNGDRLRLVRL